MLQRILGIFFFLIITINAQTELYTPFEIQKAYEKQTRSKDGKPGINYWQNYSDYKIQAELIVNESLLKGKAEIKYFNESPDSLDRLVLRLYQNVLRKGSARDWSLSANGDFDEVIISSLKINDKEIDLTKQRYTATNLIVSLNEKLEPQNNLTVEVEWSLKIPIINAIRMGNYGEGEIFVAYWYPQIAVYDDVDGWDVIDYNGIVEFYNDINNFDVEIKLPPKYLLWFTGVIQNMNEIFSEEIVNRFEKAKESEEVVRIVTQEDHKNNSVFKNENEITYKIAAEKVPDFSFAVSDNYNWDGVAAIVDRSNNRKVLAQAAYGDSARHYENAALYSKYTLEYMSEELPGFPYQYPEMTSFANKNSSGGMETPMMANNGEPFTLYGHIGLIFHEIAHNYFPFMMGNNERKYAWMDEGWASFYPREIVEKYAEEYDYLAERIKGYEAGAGQEGELPMIVPSYSVKGGQTRTNFYNRPAVAYFEMMELLGRENFKNAVLEYMNRWIGKHPLPNDFFYSINDYMKEDLNWFWKAWFYDFGYPDLCLADVSKSENNYKVTIRKNGVIPTRVYIKAYSADGEFIEVEKNARVWKDGNSEIEIELASDKELVRFELGNAHIPDVVRSNNKIEGSIN